MADGEITNNDFFLKLPTYWGFEKGNRLQGMGWERVGKRANFQQLAKAFLAISQAHKSTRMMWCEESSTCCTRKSARAAFFSEMLCLHYPDQYPLLNDPVRGSLPRVSTPPHGVQRKLPGTLIWPESCARR